MKQPFIMAVLCLIATSVIKANGQGISSNDNDSSFYQKLKTDIKNKKSFYSFEYGMTGGPSLVAGKYFVFEYTKKTERRIQTGLLFSYSSYNFNTPLVYSTTIKSIEDQYNSSTVNYETQRTRTIRNEINQLDLFEIGVSARYNITKKLSVNAAGTINIGQRVRNNLYDRQIDSTFRTDQGEMLLYNTRDNDYVFRGYGSLGRERSIEGQIGLHLGIEQKLSKRVRIHGRASMPFSTLFPKNILYDYYSGENITLNKEDHPFPNRPVFIKAGLSWTF